nr:zinc finger, SWIM-type [Tanacetum cinerariifolium]
MRRVNLDERVEKAIKMIVKDGKHFKKGKTVTCSQCGSKGHNKRAFSGLTQKHASGKGNKEAREGVADVEPSEVANGPSQPV